MKSEKEIKAKIREDRDLERDVKAFYSNLVNGWYPQRKMIIEKLKEIIIKHKSK